MTTQDIQVQGRLWLHSGGRDILGPGRAELLEHIRETGSITQAAKRMGMSYKSAWDAVDAMNQALGRAVVDSSTGGNRGGGSRLSPAGEQLLAEYTRLVTQHQAWLLAASAEIIRRLD
jgi:molybdate transport system regulatory protein